MCGPLEDHDPFFCSTEVNAMRSRFSSWVGLALVSLFLVLGSTAAQGAPTATLTTNRGCGGSATFQNGETIRVQYSVSENATVTITLTRPDGFVQRPVFQRFIPAGVTQEYVGTVGGVSGPRQLFLDATSATGTMSVECIYYGVGGPPFPPPPPPPPPPGQLTAVLETNRGCGPTALFARVEVSEFRYRVSQDAFVTLRLQRPDGTVSTLLLNQPVLGGVTHVVRGVIGDPPGQRQLTLTAVSGSQTAQAQCAYTGQGGGPTPSPLALSVDKGCGASYRMGEGIVITYRAPATSSLTLLLQMPDGTSRVLFANRLVLGGQTYALTGVVGTPLGTRTLTLRASGSADVTCQFTGIP
jgi:hypothetical protein